MGSIEETERDCVLQPMRVEGLGGSDEVKVLGWGSKSKVC